jgi:hypothetical protein
MAHACEIIVWVSVALFPKCAQNLILLLSRIYREIASGQIHDLKYKDTNISTSTQLLEILYTDTKDILVLSSTVAR